MEDRSREGEGEEGEDGRGGEGEVIGEVRRSGWRRRRR